MPPLPGPAAAPSNSAFVAKLRNFLGDMYQYGAAGPDKFDCSGLVQWALASIGIHGVPRTSEQQWAWVDKFYDAKQLQPGDLIFEQWPGDGPSPGHVAIYTGNGRIEEAPETGVPVHSIPWSPGQVTAEGATIVGYGRVPGLSYDGQVAPASSSGGKSSGGSTFERILSDAGTQALSWLFPGGSTALSQAQAGTASGDLDEANALLLIARPITQLVDALDWTFHPSHVIRIIAGVGGGVLVLMGAHQLAHAGSDRPAALPLGMVLTGVGGVALFIGLHNLPSDVQTFPDLIGYVSQQASTGGQAKVTELNAGGE